MLSSEFPGSPSGKSNSEVFWLAEEELRRNNIHYKQVIWHLNLLWSCSQIYQCTNSPTGVDRNSPGLNEPALKGLDSKDFNMKVFQAELICETL